MCKNRKYVYILITKNVNPIRMKIGETDNNPSIRIKQIFSGMPYDIELLHSFETKKIKINEIELQEIFYKYHIKGDWFEYSKQHVNQTIFMLKDLEILITFEESIKRSWKICNDTMYKTPKDLINYFDFFSVSDNIIEIRNGIFNLSERWE